MSKKCKTHYVIMEPNEYDEIFTACGRFLTTNAAANFKGYVQGRNKHWICHVSPAETDCPECMETEVWKKAVARQFTERMTK